MRLNFYFQTIFKPILFLVVEKLDNFEEINEFTEGYIQILNNSNCSGINKIKLKKNLSIAPNSFKLWSEYDGLFVNN